MIKKQRFNLRISVHEGLTVFKEGGIGMKIFLIMLLDDEAQNYAHKLAFNINKVYKTGLLASRLPQHITLGPGIEVGEDLEAVENYLEGIAKFFAPFEVRLPKLELKIIKEVGDGLGIIWLNVAESESIEALHSRIYKDILKYGWEVDPIFGDEGYQFHSTIVLGGQPTEVYKKIYDGISVKDVSLKSRVSKLAILCPQDDKNEMGTYITYKVVPLKG